MGKLLGLNEKLDFKEKDLTAPDKVIEEFLNQLPEETNGIVLGKIAVYDGRVLPYTTDAFSGIREMFSTWNKPENIQEDLGGIGEEKHRFECYLYTPEYSSYKYRLFFAEYGIANYPVDIVLEESIAEEIRKDWSGYIYSCKTKRDLDDLLICIFSSKRILQIMQKFIKINQVKKVQGKETKQQENQ